MQALINELNKIVSVAVLEGDDIGERYEHDWSSEPYAKPLAVTRPANTEELASIMQLCHQHDQSVVVQGGLTGLCGGGNAQEGELAISLERMKGIVEIDEAAMTMTVLAGTPLQVIQEAADAAGFVFPLDLGARGTCNIGGNISTNAGGNQVLRFGMTRNLVLGLEAVLADGSIISSMNKMLKNNAGYDLKQLFIGTEGTLGIVTRAVLRLFPKPNSCCTALLALKDFASVIKLLHHCRGDLGSSLSAFEVMWSSYYHFVTDNMTGRNSPFTERHPIYVLVEIEGGDQELDQNMFENVLGGAFEEGIISDAAVAGSGKDRESFWMLRDGVAEMSGFIKDTGNFDVSVPISSMEPFLNSVQSTLKSALPAINMLVFGHIADSNLHFICYTGQREDIELIHELVYRVVGEYAGSVSAEHGIGLQKIKALHYSRTEQELALMRTLKQALDPKGILNKGRVLPTS